MNDFDGGEGHIETYEDLAMFFNLVILIRMLKMFDYLSELE